ncbi:MAG TPA: ABC transporter substrate-binding protein [Acidimicrobiales bacterium]
MKYGRFARTALLVALVFGAAAYGSAPASATQRSIRAAKPSGSPIVIGSVGTYSVTTGNFADAGEPAIEAWADWVNAHGGINGHPIKLIVKNNMNNEAQAVSLVKQLVQQDHVVAFVSNEDGSLNTGYATYLQQQNIPVLGGSVYTLEPWDSNPMFFPQGMTAIPQLTAIVQSAKKLGYKTIGSLACSESAQCAEANAFLKPLADKGGVQYVYGGLVSSTAADYTASCLAAQQAGAKSIVLLVPTAAEGQTIAGDCARQGYKPAYIIPGEAIGPGYLKLAAFDNGINNAPTQPWFSTAPDMKTFHEAMKKYTNINFKTVEEPMDAVDAWVSGLMFQEAVKLSGATGVPTSQDILTGLSKFNDQTLGGMTGGLTFNDPTNKSEGCYFTVVIKKQQFTLPGGSTPSCVPSS